MATMNIMYGTPALTNDAVKTHRLGTLMEYRHPTYGPQLLMYVKFTDAITYAAGQPLGWSATEGDEDYVVTNDISEDNGVAAGIATRAHTTAYYGWMVVQGVCEVQFNNDDDAADGDVVIFGAADGVANTGSDSGLLAAFGVVVEAVVTATNIAVCRINTLK
jgi:hypothetical protein